MRSFKTEPADVLFYTALVAALALLAGSVIALLIASISNQPPVEALRIDPIARVAPTASLNALYTAQRRATRYECVKFSFKPNNYLIT